MENTTTIKIKLNENAFITKQGLKIILPKELTFEQGQEITMEV